MDDARKQPPVALICVLLALATLAVYWPVVNHDFVNYDDPLYVTENSQVQAGLTKEGIAWAFGRIAGEGTYWHPLTWLSHMLDCQIYGLNAGGHHATSLLLHAFNAVMLYLVLTRMTKETYRSAAVAALFAFHPLQVDTVAWVTERKNLLSTAFWILTLLAYVRYMERPIFTRYALVLLCFGLGLMAKPLLVTLPFVLLLLDYWPLRRWPATGQFLARSGTSNSALQSRAGAGTTLQRLIVEKLPLFALSAASSAVTWMGHRDLGVLLSTRHVSWTERLANAAISYWRYIRKVIWPADLAVFYPYPGAWPTWQVCAAILFLLIVSACAVIRIRKQPSLAVGWFWFVGSLVPFIGLVQASVQSMADRFAYVPIIGLFIMLAWAAPDLLATRRYGRTTMVWATVAMILAFMAATRLQVSHWKNSETLFRHAIKVTTGNFLAHNNLGNALALKGEVDEATAHYSEALRIEPNYPDAHYNLGLIRAGQGRTREAVARYRETLRLNPNYSAALNNLAWILASHHDPQFRDGAEAVRLAEQACQLTRNRKAIMLGTLAAAYAEAGRFDDAVTTAEKARTVALTTGQKDLASKNAALLDLYRSRQPYREPAGPQN